MGMTHGNLTLADLGEDEVVRRLCALLPAQRDVRLGAGDDCALVRPARGLQVLKTDVVIEGVHFTPQLRGEWVGRKAMGRVVSDFAAMAAKPRHALVTLLAPPQTPWLRVRSVYRGLLEMAQRFGIAVVGGETSRSAALTLSVCLSGEVAAGRWVGRHGAKAGDTLWVSGVLGGSLRRWHWSFEPRLHEAQQLARQLPLRAMMDLSDGLRCDLPRLAARCGLGFEIDLSRLPRRRGCSVEQALSDGEDYELLFALDGRVGDSRVEACAQRLGLRLTRIGRLLPSGQVAPDWSVGGWEPFRKP
jgi:thiamine-monophosphate kinase